MNGETSAGRGVCVAGVALAAVSLVACGSSRAVSPPDAFRAVNRCLSAHHFSIVLNHQRVYRDVQHREDPGNGTVKRFEEADYTVPAKDGVPSFPTHAAEVDEFATTHDAKTFASYWRTKLQTPYYPFPGVPASRLAGSTGPIAWLRESVPWSPAKIVAGCVGEHF